MTTKKFKVGDKVVVRKTGEIGTIIDPSTRKPSVRLENGEIVAKGSKGLTLHTRSIKEADKLKDLVSRDYVNNLANEAYENAAQVKEWSKYDVEETPSSLALVFAGLFLGVVVTMILVTPSIIQACN